MACSDRHASIIQRHDGIVTIINHSDDEPIFINRYRLEPGQSFAIQAGDYIDFSGDELFKFIECDQLPSVVITSSPRLSPD